jgi:hypothetical protein
MRIWQSSILTFFAAGESMAVAETLMVDNEPSPMTSWRETARTFPERLPLSFFMTIILIAALVIGEQFLEEAIVGPINNYEPWQRLGIRIALPVLSVYLLLTSRILKREVIECLVRIRPSVKIDPQAFEALARRMIRPRRIVEFILLLISTAVVVVLFVVMENPLPIYTTLTIPQNFLSAAYIVFIYTLIGWLGLSLVYTGTQHAIYLSQLARQPLSINVFDPENLLPFGSISLLHSLVLAGVVVILRVLLGQPTSPASYLVITLASLGSLLALILPLLGVYQQMRRAKIKALNNISDQLLAAQDVLLHLTDPMDDGVTELNARTNALVNLRKTILESPNWPFRSNTAVVRAVVAAMSPLIYFVLIELVRVYVVPILIG